MNINKDIWDNTYTGIIYDVMKYDIEYTKPFIINHKEYFFMSGEKNYGFAFTCLGEKIYKEEQIQDHIRIKMMESVQANSFQVIANGSEEVAITGDITCALFSKKGAKGALIDGYARDIDLISKETPAFALFGKGTIPIDAYGKWQIKEFNIPVTFNGIDGIIIIHPGDLVFCDKTATIIIPKELILKVEDFMMPRIEAEKKVRERIKNNDDFMDIYKEEERW